MSDIETRPLGRPCKSCEHSRRADLEADLLSGEHAISRLSTEYELTISSIRRHLNQHMQVTAEQARQAGLGAADIASRMLDLAGRLEDLFEDAEERRSPTDAARVGTVLGRLYLGLMDRGVVPDLVEKNRALEFDVKILTTAMRAYPELAATVADNYEAADYLSAADRVRTLFPETKELHQ
jgi:hypothetical protein